jgi:hypothetical protein
MVLFRKRCAECRLLAGQMLLLCCYRVRAVSLRVAPCRWMPDSVWRTLDLTGELDAYTGTRPPTGAQRRAAGGSAAGSVVGVETNLNPALPATAVRITVVAGRPGDVISPGDRPPAPLPRPRVRRLHAAADRVPRHRHLQRRLPPAAVPDRRTHSPIPFDVQPALATSCVRRVRWWCSTASIPDPNGDARRAWPELGCAQRLPRVRHALTRASFGLARPRITAGSSSHGSAGRVSRSARRV